MNQSNHRSAGTPDSGFGKGGVLLLPLEDVIGSFPDAMLELPNGQLLMVVAATRYDQSPNKVARLNDDGSLDTSFGSAGIIEISFPDNYWFSPRRIVSTADGGWLLVGTAEHNQRGVVLSVVRQLADGQMDADFGDNGCVVIEIGDLFGERAVANTRFACEQHNVQSNTVIPGAVEGGVRTAIQADGKILLVCTLILGPFDDHQGLVVRLNPDGSLDRTFNDSGFIQVELPGVRRRVNSADNVVVQEDGSIVVCGQFTRHEIEVGSEAYLIRYDRDGRIDAQFGENKNGLVAVPRSGHFIAFSSMILMPGGDGLSGIIAMGRAGDRGLISVLNSSGSFNRIFNNGQPLFTTVKESDYWQHAGLQRNTQGAITALIVNGQGGGQRLGEYSSLLTACFHLDGKLNTAFGLDGFVEFKEKEGFEVFSAGLVLSNNKIMASGFKIDGPSPLAGHVVRYWG